MQGGLASGHRADFLTVDMESPALLGVPPSHVLDALVFSSPGAVFGDVFVAGERAAAKGQQATLASAFNQAMNGLWR